MYLITFWAMVHAACGGCLWAGGLGGVRHFGPPQPVTIYGLPMGSGSTALSTEEPYISRDGRFLFFNSASDEGHKDLHFAEQVSEKWIYRGPLGPKVNTAKQVEGNPTMDRNHIFYYIDSSLPAMVRTGRFLPNEGELHDLRAVQQLPQRKVRVVAQRFHGTMGVEVSADGQILFFSQATWKMRGIRLGAIVASDLQVARRHKNGWDFNETDSRRVLSAINSADLEYAASISEDSRELFFTRLDAQSIATGQPRSKIMRTVRLTAADAFGKPQTIESIGTGEFVEAPAISPDGTRLYYHKRVGKKFRLYMVQR